MDYEEYNKIQSLALRIYKVGTHIPPRIAFVPFKTACLLYKSTETESSVILIRPCSSLPEKNPLDTVRLPAGDSSAIIIDFRTTTAVGNIHFVRIAGVDFRPVRKRNCRLAISF